MNKPTKRDAHIVKILAILAFAVHVAFTSFQAQANPAADTRPHPAGSPVVLMERCQPKDGYPHHAVVTLPNGDVTYTGNMAIVNKAILQGTTSQDYGYTVHGLCK